MQQFAWYKELRPKKRIDPLLNQMFLPGLKMETSPLKIPGNLKSGLEPNQSEPLDLPYWRHDFLLLRWKEMHFHILGNLLHNVFRLKDRRSLRNGKIYRRIKKDLSNIQKEDNYSS